jgi:nitrile hydratase beta subunit
MNSVHDMGGMHGLGSLERDTNDELFHAPWEARVFGLMSSLGAHRKWPGDRMRQMLESIPAAEYLRTSYYEKWFTAATALALEAGMVTAGEIAAGRADPAGQRFTPVLRPESVAPRIAAGGTKTRPLDAPPRFAPGERVRARVMNPTTHTRLPRYLRGHAGLVTAHHGAQVFPDSHAIFQGENPQHVYTVRFHARDLWGDAAPAHDTLCADLWEPYLDPA